MQSFKRFNCIESIFNDFGLSYIFSNQICFIDVKYITQILQNQFIQKWYTEIKNSSEVNSSQCKKKFGVQN